MSLQTPERTITADEPLERGSSELAADVVATLTDLQARIDRLEQEQAASVRAAADPNRLNMLIFESHRDRLLAAFVIANGAAACGMTVTMFFTFWGTATLRKRNVRAGNKSLVERAFGWMLPGSLRGTKLSQMDMCGIGRHLMQREMRKKNIADLEDLVATAASLGVNLRICEMSMKLMGIRREELIDYPNLEFCGVAKFVDDAAAANTTLFI